MSTYTELKETFTDEQKIDSGLKNLKWNLYAVIGILCVSVFIIPFDKSSFGFRVIGFALFCSIFVILELLIKLFENSLKRVTHLENEVALLKADMKEQS